MPQHHEDSPWRTAGSPRERLCHQARRWSHHPHRCSRSISEYPASLPSKGIPAWASCSLKSHASEAPVPTTLLKPFLLKPSTTSTGTNTTVPSSPHVGVSQASCTTGHSSLKHLVFWLPFHLVFLLHWWVFLIVLCCL